MIPEQTESIIVGRRKIELSSEKSIRIGEALPVEYEEIVTELAKNSQSKNFAEQAKKTIYYFYALDSGKELFDEQGQKIEITKLADLIATFPYIKQVYTKHKRSMEPSAVSSVLRRRQLSSGDPEKSFPQWIRDRVKLRDAQLPEEAPILEGFYKAWSDQNQTEAYDGKHGHYSMYPEEFCPAKSEKLDAQFKGYIEIESSEPALLQAFTLLKERKLHPHESKIFDHNRIVLYWSSDLSSELSSKIQAAFNDAGVTFRGPGQDSIELNLTETGKIEVDARASNDASLGEDGNANFAQESFDKTVFLRKYLNQSYKYWRNPLNPYRLSYVPVFDLREVQDKDILNTLQPQVSSELVIFDHRGISLDL